MKAGWQKVLGWKSLRNGVTLFFLQCGHERALLGKKNRKTAQCNQCSKPEVGKRWAGA